MLVVFFFYQKEKEKKKINTISRQPVAFTQVHLLLPANAHEGVAAKEGVEGSSWGLKVGRGASANSLSQVAAAWDAACLLLPLAAAGAMWQAWESVFGSC